METSSVIYKGGLRTEAEHLKSSQKIVTDAPTDNNGKGEAFSPTDLAATALGSCAITVMSIAAEKEGISFKDSQILITKIMSTDSPRRIIEIVAHFKLRVSPTLNEDQKARFERVAHTCPVAQSLHPDIKQNMSFEWL